MMKLSHWYRMAGLLLALLLAACGGGTGSSAAPPTGGIVATPGNGQVTITWTATPGVEYWLMYAATATPIDIKNPPGLHNWATAITSPYVVTGLANGTTYSFAMNGRISGGPGGSQSPSVSTVPRAAGSTWIAGTSLLGSGDIRGVAYGTASDSTVNYLAVGTGGALYKGPEGVSQGLTGMVWTALSPSPALTIDFRAATYAFSRYIAVGASGGAASIVYSSDLSTWSTPVTPGGTGLNAMANNGSIVVAVGDGGTAFYTADGASWTAITTGTTANLYGVGYSAAVGWIFVGANGTLRTSTDLVNWNNPTSGAVATDLNGITVASLTSGYVYAAVGAGGVALRSTDGLNWTAQTLSGVANLYAVSTDSAQFLAAGAGGALFTSSDASTWTRVTQSATTSDLLAIIGSSSKYMVVGRSGANISSIN